MKLVLVTDSDVSVDTAVGKRSVSVDESSAEVVGTGEPLKLGGVTEKPFSWQLSVIAGRFNPHQRLLAETQG